MSTPDQARRAAVALIRCMRSRDLAGAEALTARLARGIDSEKDTDAVMAWVWHLETVAQWRRERAAEQRDRLGRVIAVLAGAMAGDEVPRLLVIENPVSPEQAARNRAVLASALKAERSAA